MSQIGRGRSICGARYCKELAQSHQRTIAVHRLLQDISVLKLETFIARQQISSQALILQGNQLMCSINKL